MVRCLIDYFGAGAQRSAISCNVGIGAPPLSGVPSASKIEPLQRS